MSNTVLYALWGGLYALCAGLGFITEPGPAMRLLMILLSVALFVPPFVLNYRAAKAKDRRTLELVRNLALGWLLVTSILLVASFLTVFSRILDANSGILRRASSTRSATEASPRGGFLS